MCEIHDKDGILTCVGHLEDSLYILDTHTYIRDSARIAQVNALNPNDNGHETALCAHSQTTTADIQLWHRRLGHIKADSILKMVRKGMVNGMAITGNSTREALGPCEPCIKGKHARQDIKKTTQT